jgi:hypothetical protein
VAGPRPPRELYNLLDDPAELTNLLAGDVPDDVEQIANELAVILHEWREQTGDVCPSEFAGPRILVEVSETYIEATVRTLGVRPTSQSPIGLHRGLRETTGAKR